VAIEAVKSDLIDVLMFSINPCYDMQPASEDVEELWAEKNYAHALQNIDPQRERLYELCEQRGVGINVMKVYGGGDLLSEKNSPFGRAFTAVQCLEYALSRPGVASIMTGIRSQEELQQALAWCNATAEERDYTQVMQGMTLFSSCSSNGGNGVSSLTMVTGLILITGWGSWPLITLKALTSLYHFPLDSLASISN
jgi:aryl-alcohol dehydrogenase-like predicted oxidoreductase